ncbi:MAG: hypothetical protein SVK08_00630 [Halobacteriota archaeon]|nr:hypothetical protein [Halobacteriota archaeon]
MGNIIGHNNRVATYAELALKQSIEFQQKSNDQLLLMQKQLHDEYLKHSADRDAHHLENNRYTLDRLYSVFPEEAVGIGTMVDLVVAALEQRGMVPQQ